MKNLFFAAIAALFLLGACGADQEVVNNMADEMCGAMELITEDPMSLMAAAEKMTEVATNSEYGSVTEAQLMEAMNEKCPEGAEKLKELSGE